MTEAKIHLRHATEPRTRCNVNFCHYQPIRMTTDVELVTCLRCLRYHKAASIKSTATCSVCGTTESKRFFGLSGRRDPLRCQKCFSASKAKVRVYQFAGEV